VERKKVAFAVAGFLVYFLLFFLLYELFIDRQRIIEIVGDRELLGPVIILALHVIQCVVFFLPGSVVAMASGYLFGTWKGFLLNIIGSTIGAALLFVIARKASRFFGYSGIVQKEVQYIRNLFKGHSKKTSYILAKMMPLVPGDTVTVFVASFTRNHFWEFLLFSTIGALPKMFVETLAGSLVKDYGLFGAPTMILVALVALVIAGSVLWRRKG
jgi:uncharacterized membrane protein YdjX (TVP38/TMEM64 family)